MASPSSFLPPLRASVSRSARPSAAAAAAAAAHVCSPSSSRLPSSSSPASSRHLHTLPPLPAAIGSDVGCQPLFQRQTLQATLWGGWQRLLLERLNDEVRGTEFEHSTIVETVIGTSQDPHRIQAFNLASQALNNAFFLESLRPKTDPSDADVDAWRSTPPPRPSRNFEMALINSFESLPSFKSAFSSAAMGMSGSGWVWLVMDGEKNLGIVPTFASGSVLVQNRTQRANISPTLGSVLSHDQQPSSQQQRSKRQQRPAKVGNQVDEAAAASVDAGGGEGATSAPPKRSPPPPSEQGFTMTRITSASSESSKLSSALGRVGENLYPLFCLSVHEHAWLGEFGMRLADGRAGKEEYLVRFWEVLDWAKVEARWTDLGGN